MASCPLEGFNESGRSVSKMVRLSLLIFVITSLTIQYASLCIDQENTALLHIYVPFWVVNKTSLDLEFEHQVFDNTHFYSFAISL